MKIRLLLFILILCNLWTFGQTLPAYVPTNNLEAWYSFTGNTNDISGHGHNLINHGATLTTDRCGNPNSAYFFNGDSNFLSSIDTFFNNGWQNYTISLWLDADTNSNPYNGNHSQTMFNTSPHYGSELSLSWGGTTNKVDFFYNTVPPSNGGWDVFSNNGALSDSTITIHKWTHVALVKSDTIYKMYLNGVLNNTFHSHAVAISYLCQIYIGTISGYQPETFWGSLDDYGVWSRSLNDSEVWQLYHNNCNSSVPSCIPLTGLVAWYPFSGNTIDETGNGHNLVNSGATLTTDRCGNANSAYSFDGDTSFLASVDTFFDNGWNAYSITLWLNSDSIINPMGGNMSQTMFNTQPHYGTELSYSWGATNKYDFFYNTQPTYNAGWDVFSNFDAESQSNVISNHWVHIALVKSDTTFKLYVNGVLDNTFINHNPNIAPSSLCQIYIGDISHFGNETFWGSLDDYGIWDRSLSSSEVWQVYNACCSPTGINDIANADVISLYPNPANDKVTVKVTTVLIGSSYNISDITGRVVMTGKITSENNPIAVGNLAPSVYMIQIGELSKQTLKFVKN